MKFVKLATAAAAFSLATAAAAAAPEVGATVYGPEGNPVGTIEAMQDGTAVVNTGTHAAPVPVTALGEGPNGPVISVTKAQLNQIIAQQKAEATTKRDAALVADAMVHTADDVMVGTVTSVNGDEVVVELEGSPAALTREQFAVNPAGTLIVLFTKAQLDEARAGGGVEAAAE